MKTVIGTIAIVSALFAFPVNAEVADEGQEFTLVNNIQASEELNDSEKAWQRDEFYTSFGGGTD